MSEIHAERHEYQHWLEGVRDSGVSPSLADYRKWAEFDGNLFWRLSCGDHQNLLDEAIEDLTAAVAALRRVRSIGATSGTNLNAWNEAFDVIDAALSEPTGAHLRVLPRERYDAVLDSGPTEPTEGEKS